MKKNILLNFLAFFSNQGNALIMDKNGFITDFSRVNDSQTTTNKYEEASKNKYGISSIVLLVMLFLFSCYSYAQQPACNLSGSLRGYFDPTGGSTISINSDVFNSKRNTTYSWTIVENTTDAAIVSGLGTSNIQVKSGTKGGNFTIKLIVTNPGQSRSSNASCTCTKSVTVSRNLNYE